MPARRQASRTARCHVPAGGCLGPTARSQSAMCGSPRVSAVVVAFAGCFEGCDLRLSEAVGCVEPDVRFSGGETPHMMVRWMGLAVEGFSEVLVPDLERVTLGGLVERQQVDSLHGTGRTTGQTHPSPRRPPRSPARSLPAHVHEADAMPLFQKNPSLHTRPPWNHRTLPRRLPATQNLPDEGSGLARV